MGSITNPWSDGGIHFPDSISDTIDRWFRRGGVDHSDKADNESGFDGGSQSETKSVLICIGNGGPLGDFNVFATALKKNHLLEKYKEENIKIVKTLRRGDFMNAILNSGLTELTELHVFSHSIGSALFLGYDNETIDVERGQWSVNHPNPSYEDVVAFETGALLTDHLLITYKAKEQSVQTALTTLEFTKFWGCNTGVSGHKYWDLDNQNPYWVKLNDKNVPKQSIAQSFATYINKPVYGAHSGSHIEFFVNGEWKSGYVYKPKKSSDYSDIRLNPDNGDYNLYNP